MKFAMINTGFFTLFLTVFSIFSPSLSRAVATKDVSLLAGTYVGQSSEAKECRPVVSNSPDAPEKFKASIGYSTNRFELNRKTCRDGVVYFEGVSVNGCQAETLRVYLEVDGEVRAARFESTGCQPASYEICFF